MLDMAAHYDDEYGIQIAPQNAEVMQINDRQDSKRISTTSRYNLLSGDDIANIPPLEWLILGVLPAKGLAALFGPSGSGKSFLVLHMLQALASGTPWFGCKVKPCSVVYVALEGEAGLSARVAAYRARNRDGKLVDSIRYVIQPFSLLTDQDIDDLASAIGKASVVVLDTLNRATPGADENDSSSMSKIIAAAKKLQMKVDGLVMLVHHTGKDSSKGMRGHSSLHAALDAAIEVKREGDYREWIIAKSKDGNDGISYPFQLEVVKIGTDDDGEPVTSCVIRQLEGKASKIKRAFPPKSGNQKIAWDALNDALKEAGDNRPTNAPRELPNDRPCISYEVAVEVIGKRLVVDNKRRNERAKGALTGLVSKRLVELRDGFLWFT